MPIPIQNENRVNQGISYDSSPIDLLSLYDFWTYMFII